MISICAFEILFIKSFMVFQTFLSGILTGVLETVPFNSTNTDHIFTLERSLVLTWACELNVGDCVSKSLEAFDKLKTNSVG